MTTPYQFLLSPRIFLVSCCLDTVFYTSLYKILGVCSCLIFIVSPVKASKIKNNNKPQQMDLKISMPYK